MSSDMLVDYGRMLDLLGIEGQLLAAATHDAHVDDLVPGTCARTLGHTVRRAGDLCEDALSWMGATEAAARNWFLPDDAGLREITGRFTARLADLLAEFGARPPDDPCPTWSPADHSVSFWLRRMVHATTIHRVDVQSAARVETTPITGDVAVDGIDEVLRLWLEHRLHALGIGATRTCSVGVRVRDHGWHIAMSPQVAAVTRPDVVETAEGVVSGDPSVIYLWLWGRVPARLVETSGDHDAIAQLWGLLRLATQ